MTASLRAYSAMKKTGVEWLGSVPQHWRVRRVKTVACIKNGATPSTNNATYWNGGIFWITPEDLGALKNRHISESNRTLSHDGFVSCGASLVGPNSIAMSTRAPIGHLGILSSEGCVNQGCKLIVPTEEVLTEYLYHVLVTARPRLQSLGQGSTFTELSHAKLGGFQLPLPSLAEQTAIVRFLDHADRCIQRHIRAKQKLIALLEEQKQAIIHQAVTGQIDARTGRPYTGGKHSRSDWLGEVPTNWEVRRVKSLSIVKRGASPRPIADAKYFEDDGEYAWVRISDVTASKHYLGKTTQRLSEIGESLSVRLEPGALFLSIAGSVGKPIITKIRCCIHDGFVYFPQLYEDAEFVYYVFLGGAPFGGLGKLGTQVNLNTETVGDICLGWPSKSERDVIVEFLTKSTGKCDSAIASVRRQISQINKFRVRIIADVVTGKLDVREAEARLPSIDLNEPEDVPDDSRCDTGPLRSDEIDATHLESEA